jgi:hypothetical protein
MNVPQPDHNGKNGDYVDSADSEIIMIEGPGDTTIRPRPSYVPPYSSRPKPPEQAPPPAPNAE